MIRDPDALSGPRSELSGAVRTYFVLIAGGDSFLSGIIITRAFTALQAFFPSLFSQRFPLFLYILLKESAVIFPLSLIDFIRHILYTLYKLKRVDFYRFFLTFSMKNTLTFMDSLCFLNA